MGQRPRELDSFESPAALFGAVLRERRERLGLSQAKLAADVPASGAMLGKIEKAERRPDAKLVAALDERLAAGGDLIRLAAAIPQPHAKIEGLAAKLKAHPETSLPDLRATIDVVRSADHGMASEPLLLDLVSRARVSKEVASVLPGAERSNLQAAVAEAYQLAGWMKFDSGDFTTAVKLHEAARPLAVKAGAFDLTAFLLGPSQSFITTYSGDPELGLEHAYSALAWAKRSGNRRLIAFTMAIAARAHARLHEADLCLTTLAEAQVELDKHQFSDQDSDPPWLAVFDQAALDGHRGSCMLDLGIPEQAVPSLLAQDSAPTQFVRNRVIWQLDRARAHGTLREIDIACADINTALDLAAPGAVTARVRGRFRAADLVLRQWESITDARQTIERLRAWFNGESV